MYVVNYFVFLAVLLNVVIKDFTSVFYNKLTFVNQDTRTQIQKVILYSKTVLKVRFKDHWFTKLNVTEI